MFFDGPVGIAEKVFSGEINKRNVVDCVVMVKPEVVYQKELSIATPDESLSSDENGIYFMASMGKILSAITTYEYLKDKGGVTTKISDLLINYPQNKSLFVDKLKNIQHYSEITVADILLHKSGIGKFSQSSFSDLTKKTNIMMPSETILELDIETGEYGQFQYSNPGYELLALILEHHSGRSFENIQRDLVLKKYNLEDKIFLRDDIVKNNEDYNVKNHEDLFLVLGINFDGKHSNKLVNLPFRAGACMYANPKNVAQLASRIWSDKELMIELQKYEIDNGENLKQGIGYIKDLKNNTIRHDGGMDGARGTVVFDINTNKTVCVIATLEDKFPRIANEKIKNLGVNLEGDELEIKRKEIIDNLRKDKSFVYDELNQLSSIQKM